MKFVEHRELNLPQVNQDVLKQWEKDDLFHKSISEREGCPSFVFYEGPPSANGHPGIHHVMARTIKDVFCRYKTMAGYQVKRKAGWDTHGLPVELGVEKELGITKEDIGRSISIEQYNEQCRRNVMKYTREWQDLSLKMGYWVDMEHPYITYENSYIETLWWLLKQLYDKGFLYKGYTIQPYSPAAGTGLSSHELNQPGCYRDVKDITATVLLRATTPLPAMEGWGTPCFAAWTTTPWTLPSNTALCVGPSYEYVVVRTYNPYQGDKLTVVMARERLAAYFNPEGENLPLEDFNVGDKIVPYRVVATLTGRDLEGLRYEPLMSWVKPCEKLSPLATDYVRQYAAEHADKCFSAGADQFVEMADCAYRVILGDYVTTDDGTGIVHIAPTFGADDMRVARAANIPSLFMIDQHGETRPMVDLRGKYYLLDECAPAFVEACVDVEQYQHHEGHFVKNAYDPRFNQGGTYDAVAANKAEDLNLVLCMEMKAAGQALKIEKQTHNYPHCWRTDKPILYYPLDSWFIRTTAVKDRLIALNNTILWKPASTGTGRFGNWLENLNDWNLSRSRFWGTPLPIWRNAQTREELCIGSIEQLYAEIDKSVAAGLMKTNPLREKGFVPGDYSEENYHRIDLHRPYVDDIVLVSPTGQPMRRESDLIDVWFDSGSMPYAQVHYPFENRELIDSGKAFPADFIAEGVDQTRGWFFTLHAIATMVFDNVSFKAVVSNGLVLDKNGNKMSKRLGNAVDPFQALDKHGADALRWYMITNAAPWDNLKFDENGVKEVSRTFFAKLFQTYAFFTMYANVDGFTGDEEAVPVTKRPEIDRWILSELNSLVGEVTSAYDAYEPMRAGRAVSTFALDSLSNWYVRLNRKRFWAGAMDDDKLSAYQTLHTCLLTLAKLIAPIAPFFADQLYQDLTHGRQGSVHLASFPVADTALIDKAEEQNMQLAQRITSLVLSLRKKEQIIVRQPLSKICVSESSQSLRQSILAVKQLILDETNVKELEFIDGALANRKVKCNFRVMGKKFGAQMKAVAAAVAALSPAAIAELESEGKLAIALPDGSSATIERADVEIVSEDIPGWTVATDGNLTLALDIELTDDLRLEGLARELVKRIQTSRKEQGLEITDRIRITMQAQPQLEDVLAKFGDYICQQVLADSFTLAETCDGAQTLDIDGAHYELLISKS